MEELKIIFIKKFCIIKAVPIPRKGAGQAFVQTLGNLKSE